MPRKFKTAEKNRVNYVYYTADGKKIVIKPGENGVTEEMITLLHTYDDEEVDADRREDYHVPVRFEGYSDDEGSELESRNSYLADSSADSLEKLMDAIEAEELETKIDNLKTALSTLTEKQQVVYIKFSIPKIDLKYENPMRQAEYAYRLIGNEVST